MSEIEKINEWKSNILQDDLFREAVYRQGLDALLFEKALEDFLITKSATLEIEDFKREKDLRRNFLYWIKFYIERNKKNGTITNKTNGFSPENPFVANYNARKEGSS